MATKSAAFPPSRSISLFAPVKAFFALPLWQQVLAGLVLGVAAGLALGEEAAHLKFLGTIFINLIKMVIAPLIFFALVFGLTSMGSSGNVSRVSLKAISFYLAASVVAVLLGISLGLLLEPGVGVSLPPEVAATGSDHAPKAVASLGETLLGIIPDNALGAMAKGHFLQVVIFAMFTGIILNMLGERARAVTELCHESAHVMFKMIDLIVRLAPIGVFGYMAWGVATQGMDIVYALAKLMSVGVLGCALQFGFFAAYIAIFARRSPWPFFTKMVEPQLVAFSTTSSKATLPLTMQVMQERMGVSNTGAHFVLPLGAALHMAGSAIYQPITALFFSQLYGIPLGASELLMLVPLCLLGSIGAAGIPSGSLIFMGMIFSSVGLPLEGIAMIAGIHRLIDMFLTTTNLTGAAVGALIVDSSESGVDDALYYATGSERSPSPEIAC